MTRSGMTRRGRAGLLAGAVAFLVLAGTGVSNAAWTSQSTVSASGTAANAALSATLGAGIGGITYSSSALGPHIAGLQVTNTGTAPLAISLAGTTTNATLAAAIRVDAWMRSGASCGTTVPTSGVVTGTLAALPTVSGLSAALAPSSSAYVCLATRFTGALASFSSQSVTATITATGAIGTNWRPTAAVSFTQAVGSAMPQATCVKSNSGVQLTWTAPPGWTAWPRGYYVRSGSLALSDPNLWASTPTQTVRPDQFNSQGAATGTYTVEIWAVEHAGQPFGSTAATLIATAQVTYLPSGGWFAVNCG